MEQTVEDFTITIAVNNSDFGSINQTSVIDVPKGSIITIEINKLYINGTEIVATTTANTSEYEYAFSGFSTFDSVVNSNMTITANFTRVTVPEKYTVTIAVNNSNYGSVNQTSIIEVPQGSIITIENNKLIINGIEIVATTTANTSEYEYAFIGFSTFNSVVNDSITITANFTRTAIIINDDGDKGPNLLWLYILLAILTGIILIMLIILLCKSKKKNSIEINKSLNKNMTADHITKKYKEQVKINKRAKFNLAGFPSPDTYFVGEGKNKKCFAYYYELGEGKQHMILSMTYDLAIEIAKKYDITASNFPKSDQGWYKLMIDDNFKNKGDLTKVLDKVIDYHLGNKK